MTRPDDAVDLSSLQPLVVTVQGHPVLVARFQSAMQTILPALSLDAVTKAHSWGGVDGIAFLEWCCGFQVTEQDLLQTGASYSPSPPYSLPSVDLFAEGARELRHQAIQRAIEKRRREAALAAEGLQLVFGEQPKSKRPRGRPKNSEKRS